MALFWGFGANPAPPRRGLGVGSGWATTPQNPGGAGPWWPHPAPPHPEWHSRPYHNCCHSSWVGHRWWRLQWTAYCMWVFIPSWSFKVCCIIRNVEFYWVQQSNIKTSWGMLLASRVSIKPSLCWGLALTYLIILCSLLYQLSVFQR